MSDYKSPFIDTPLGEYFEVSPKGIAFPLQKKAILEDNPLGKNSDFYENHCGEFSEDFNINKTDYDQLATDLKNNLNDPKFIFNWSKYTSQRFTQSRYRVSVKDIYLDRDVKGLPKYVKTRHDIPFKYNLDGEEKSGYFEEARFNKRICSLNPEPQYSINIDIKKLEASFKIFLFYKNDREKGFNLSNYDPDNDGTFGVPSKYIAIRLTSKKATDFLAFWELIKGTPLSKSTLKAEFKELYSKNTTDGQLDWLYSITPISLIKEKSLQELWKDTIRLLKYDTDRYFTDNSSNQIKVLEAIASKENDKISGMQFLYNQFEDHPEKIKEIYTALDGTSTSDYTLGRSAHNKTIFTSLLQALCNHNGQGFHRYKQFITFKNTSDYQISSSYDYEKYNEGKFALYQEVRIITDRFGRYDGTQYLHPLDIVNLIIEDSNGKEITFQVPVIFIKDQAFQRELKELIKVIRIGIDILLVVVSAYTLAQGTTPLLTAISFIDLGIATGDLAIQAFEEEIRKIKGPKGEPWGEDFLDTWEQIYIIGGFITAVPLIGLMLKNGAKSLLKAAGNTKVQLVNMLKYGIKNGNLKNFIKSPFKVIADVFKETKFAFRLQQKLNKLQKKGVLIIQEGDAYKLSYGDEIIAQGKNAKEIRKEIDGFFKGGKVVDGVLDDLVKSITLEKAAILSKSISDATKGKIVIQNIKELDDLYKAARVANKELKEITAKFATQTGGKAGLRPQSINNGLKGRKRALEKIAEYGGDASKLVDIAGSKIVYETIDELYKALEKFSKQYEILRIKDRIIKPLPNGYRDILMNIRMKNGHIVEFRLHLKMIDEVAKIEHDMYKVVRTIENKAKVEVRDLTLTELNKKLKIEFEAKRLFDKAWKQQK